MCLGSPKLVCRNIYFVEAIGFFANVGRLVFPFAGGATREFACEWPYSPTIAASLRRGSCKVARDSGTRCPAPLQAGGQPKTPTSPPPAPPDTLSSLPSCATSKRPTLPSSP